MLEGDVGGFGVGSDFSWQVVGTYGFDVIVSELHSTLSSAIVRSPSILARMAGSVKMALTMCNMGR